MANDKGKSVQVYLREESHGIATRLSARDRRSMTDWLSALVDAAERLEPLADRDRRTIADQLGVAIDDALEKHGLADARGRKAGAA